MKLTLTTNDGIVLEIFEDIEQSLGNANAQSDLMCDIVYSTKAAIKRGEVPVEEQIK